MDTTYWHKQALDKPLFPDLVWSRPENRAHAGKLLIIGGNSFGFASVGAAYEAAMKSGAGTVRVLLPDALQKFAGVLPNGEFAPSTPSGSFSQKALADWLEHSTWADGVLLAGDLARNSETAIVLERFMDKYAGHVTLTGDAAEHAVMHPELTLHRPDTVLVLDFAHLQKFFSIVSYPQAVTSRMGIIQLVEILHQFTTTYSVYIMTKQSDTLYIAVNGQVSTTTVSDQRTWQINTAAAASTWWLQNPDKPFQALSTALLP